MQSLQPGWHKIAESIAELQLQHGGATEVQVAGKTVCVINHKGQLHAYAAKCPHAGGIMCNGYVDALDNIVCPLHRYKFSLKNGRNTSGEGYFLKIYPIKEDDDGIWIQC